MSSTSTSPARGPSSSTSSTTSGLPASYATAARVGMTPPGAEHTVPAMTMHAVVIAGGGPTGLMLAGELALARIDVAIVERRATQELAGIRASGLHSRTLEVFDQRGIVDRFVSQGQKHPAVHFQVPLDISDFPTRHNYTLGIAQNQVERILAERAGELSVPIYRAREVAGISQDGDGVDVALAG